MTTTTVTQQNILDQMRERWKKVAQFHYTDSGNADAFAYLFGDVIKYDNRQGRWLIWSDPLWKADNDQAIIRKAREVIDMRAAALPYVTNDKHASALRWVVKSESAFTIQSMLKLAAADKAIKDEGDNWDADDWLLGCENGIVDLRTGKLRKGKPEDRITISTGLNFDPQAPCPRWMQFLDEVFCHKELIDFVWRAVGYSLTGATHEEVLFMCYGTGANGKSKFINRLSDMLGAYHWKSQFSAFEALEKRAGVASGEIASLAGKRCVTASESRKKNILDEAMIKSLTGGEEVSARFLHKNLFVFRPKMKIWLSANHLPPVEDNSHGFWRRVRLITFEQTFKDKTQDKDLEKKLRAETPGILAWAVRGCVEWQKRGLEPPQCVIDATANYKASSDTLTEFIKLYCVTDKHATVYAGELLTEYNNYLTDIGEKTDSGQSFGRRIAELGFKRERDSKPGVRKLIYRGIGLIGQNP